jgi:hypothetical protein
LYIDETIWNWGGGFTIGFQRTLLDIIHLDVYAGGGIQWSEIDFSYSPLIQSTRPLNEYQDIYTPGYEGIMPKFGIQIGITL